MAARDGGARPVLHAQPRDRVLEQVEKARALYRSHGLGAGDDAVVMQYLVPGWKFDPKRPSLVR